jgi:hypothetical protein
MPEPVGERRVDLRGLPRDALLLVAGQVLEGAHVVQPVRELDEDHPDVVHHREDHLSEVLGLFLLAARELAASRSS